MSATGWPSPARRCAALLTLSSFDVSGLTPARAASTVGPATRAGAATSAGGVRGDSACEAAGGAAAAASTCWENAVRAETVSASAATAAVNAIRERACMSVPGTGRRAVVRGARSMVAPLGCRV